MTLLFTLLTLLVIGVVAAVAAGSIRGGLDAAATSLPARGLPTGPVSPDDVENLRFSPALRGYRMEEVDAVLDRLTEELRARDEQIAQLRGERDPGSTGDYAHPEGPGRVDDYRRPEPAGQSEDPGRPDHTTFGERLGSWRADVEN